MRNSGISGGGRLSDEASDVRDALRNATPCGYSITLRLKIPHGTQSPVKIRVPSM